MRVKPPSSRPKLSLIRAGQTGITLDPAPAPAIPEPHLQRSVYTNGEDTLKLVDRTGRVIVALTFRPGIDATDGPIIAAVWDLLDLLDDGTTHLELL